MESGQTPSPIFFDLAALPCWVQIIDFVILAVVITAVIYWVYLWKGKDKSQKENNEDKEDFQHRQDLGAGTVETQLNAGLTSASVLAAGAFALLGITRAADAPIPTAASTQLVIGVIWLVISILIGVWNSGVMTVKVTTRDVSGVASINIMLVAQLWSIVAGGFTILVSLFLII
jgi:hypothetical protein